MLGLGFSLPQTAAREAGAGQWWPGGASMALDFVQGRAMKNSMSVAITDLISCTRSTTGTAKDSAGNDIAFGIDELRITDLGLYIHQADGGTAADDIKFTDIDWIDPDLGTFLVEWEQMIPGSGTQILVRWQGPTWSRIRSGSAAIMQLQDDTLSLIFNNGMFSPPPLGIHKLACAIAPNNMAIARDASLDGGLSTDTSGIPFSTVNEVRLGGVGGNEMLNGRLRSVIYWPVRKSDADLQGMVG